MPALVSNLASDTEMEREESGDYEAQMSNGNVRDVLDNVAMHSSVHFERNRASEVAETQPQQARNSNVLELRVQTDNSWSSVNGAASRSSYCEGESRWLDADDEPIHMTLEDCQHSLYDWEELNDNSQVPNRNKTPDIRLKLPKNEERTTAENDNQCKESRKERHNRHHRHSIPNERSPNSKSLKHTLCHWLGLGKCTTAEAASTSDWPETETERSKRSQKVGFSEDSRESSFVNRALPPLPKENIQPEDITSSSPANPTEDNDSQDQLQVIPDSIITYFSESICKVKDCGWYWGPISGEVAEKILSNEPDGSFVVRDSSDERYIFSLTFKLNGFVRHVRIEHDHGNFSFGSFTKFKSHTIVDFIENAVMHSRSGRYLFFLHRRPALGPMRVQLLYPVSRFKQVQSLQHMCRFVILKAVRRDLIAQLPIPAKLKSYLDTQQYYTEHTQDLQSATTTKPPDLLSSADSLE